MTWKVWDVQGRFVIPGTRETVSLDKTRIGAQTKAQASEDLAKILTSKFGKKLRGGHCFNRHFAIGQLQWEPMPIKKAEAAPIQPPTDEEAALLIAKAAQEILTP